MYVCNLSTTAKCTVAVYRRHIRAGGKELNEFDSVPSAWVSQAESCSHQRMNNKKTEKKRLQKWLQLSISRLSSLHPQPISCSPSSLVISTALWVSANHRFSRNSTVWKLETSANHDCINYLVDGDVTSYKMWIQPSESSVSHVQISTIWDKTGYMTPVMWNVSFKVR